MENDPRMIELLTDMSIKLDKLDNVAQRLGGLEAEQLRTTNAIISLSSLLQKAIIEPHQYQAQEIIELKERVSRLEQTIIH
jgi:hypothetical protein